MSTVTGRGRGPIGVVTAVSGPGESTVAVALSGRRDLVLVRRCADVAELLSVAEVGLAAVAVVNEAFPGVDGDVVDRLRRGGVAVLGVVDPDRESSERLRAWAVPVLEVRTGPGREPDGDGALASAVLAAVARTGGRGDASPGAGAGDGPAREDAGGAASPPGRSLSAPPSLRRGSPDDGGGRAGGRDGGGDNGGPPTGGRSDGEDDHEDDHEDEHDGHGEDHGEDDGGDDGGDDGRHRVGGGPDPGEPGDPSHPGHPAAPAAVGAAGHAAPLPRDGAAHSARLATSARGRVVAVWGPPGAPGRTTVAVGLAAELAQAGSEVLLVDADTYAASVAQVLGLLDESPGLVAAVRAGLDGRLDPLVLARLAPVASPRLRVLTGLTRAARWSELRPAGLQAVLAAGRALVDVVVVDLAPPLEEDEELSYDTAAPRRNGAALDVLRAADDVVVVGSADPVGLQRLVRALQDLAAAVPSATPVVVVNRVRADAVGRHPAVRVTEALARFAGVEVRHLVPDDRPATDRALLAGRTLVEQAPDSPARLALRALAASVVPGTGQEVRRGARTRSPRGARRLATGG